MKVYDLDGCIIEKKVALIAVSLPKPEQGNAYFIFRIHKIRKNEILIHLKDFLDLTLTDSSNLEPFVIDLTIKEFADFDLTKKIDVTLVHNNSDNLPAMPMVIYDESTNPSILTGRVGTGTIRP